MDHEAYIRRCFDLALNGQGRVEPNPMVGSVVVAENRIIGEGNHEFFGGPHGEVNALKSVSSEDEHLLQEATVYVNLEPCCIHAKTPPCSQLLVSKKVKRVVVSALDPNPQVAGNGLKEMRAAGIEVIDGVLESEGRELNRRFYTYHQKQRPYVILKWGQTRNGFMASHLPEQKWITNDAANCASHLWRTQEAAIMVGTNTAAIDNPQLTARLAQGRNPLRVVLDRTLRLPGTLHLMDQIEPTLVYTKEESQSKKNLEFVQVSFDDELLPRILSDLRGRGIISLIVEGGPFLLNSFIEKNLWDETRITTAAFSWEQGKNAPTIFGNLVSEQAVDDNVISTFRNPKQPLNEF